MKKYLTLRILLGIGIFGCGSTLALASMGSPMATQQQSSSSAMPSSQGAHAPNQMSAQPPSGPKVGPGELHHFAAAIIAVRPINQKVRRDLATQKLTQTQHQQLIQTYTQKVKTVLTKNHLSPVAYETLMKKAQTNPAFAQRVETVIKAHSG